MNLRRQAFLPLATCGLLLSASAARSTPDAVHLAFDPPEALIECIGPVHITVDSAATDLRGFSLVVEFDPLIVEVDDVEEGPLLAGADCPSFLQAFYTPGADSLVIDAAALGCSMSGAGAIVTIQFRRSPPSSHVVTPVSLRRAVLRTGSNETIPYTTTPGEITAYCPIAVEPTTWARTKAEYRDEESP